MSTIPVTPDQVSAEWLTQVLDAPVESATVVDANAGTTGRAVLEIESEPGALLPPRLFIKLPPTDPMQQAFVQSSGMGKREAMFYQGLAAEVPVRVPRCFHADTNDAGTAYIMVLEHLEDSGCTFQNASTRYSHDYVRQVLAEFARLHGAYWNTSRFDSDLAWVTPPVQHEIAVQLIASALEQHAADMPAVFTEMGELYLAEADAIHRLWQRGDDTVIHGDAHDANLFYDKNRPGFLDWAIVSRAPGMRDVGYFLAGTLPPGEHLDVGRDMLAYYRQQLQATGIEAPSAEELWQQYQWHAAYVWVGAAVTLAMGDAWQPVNYVMKSLENLHAALDSLDSVSAIKSSL